MIGRRSFLAGALGGVVLWAARADAHHRPRHAGGPSTTTTTTTTAPPARGRVIPFVIPVTLP